MCRPQGFPFSTFCNCAAHGKFGGLLFDIHHQVHCVHNNLVLGQHARIERGWKDLNRIEISPVRICPNQPPRMASLSICTISLCHQRQPSVLPQPDAPP